MLHAPLIQKHSQSKTLPAGWDGNRERVPFLDSTCQRGLRLRLTVHQEDSLQPADRRLHPRQQFMLVGVTAQLIQLYNLCSKTKRLPEDRDVSLLVDDLAPQRVLRLKSRDED